MILHFLGLVVISMIGIALFLGLMYGVAHLLWWTLDFLDDLNWRRSILSLFVLGVIVALCIMLFPVK